MFGDFWYAVKDGDKRLYALYRRHYTSLPYKKRTRANGSLFCGPGEKLPLLAVDGSAGFVWRRFIDKSGQKGVNCAFFRNEGDRLSSTLILEAEELAWKKWPGQRLYTYVNPRKVKSVNPGCCFLKAGWKRLEQKTTKGLLIFEKIPKT